MKNQPGAPLADSHKMPWWELGWEFGQDWGAQQFQSVARERMGND